jgi:hypothetical protein
MIVQIVRLIVLSPLHKKCSFFVLQFREACFSQKIGCFKKYSDVSVENTLLIDNTLCKSLFNGPFNAIFFKTSDNFVKDNNNYLLGAILPYLEAL